MHPIGYSVDRGMSPQVGFGRIRIPESQHRRGIHLAATEALDEGHLIEWRELGLDAHFVEVGRDFLSHCAVRGSGNLCVRVVELEGKAVRLAALAKELL